MNVTAISTLAHRDITSDVDAYNPGDMSVYVDSGLTINIDPVTSYIWVPRSACEAFEKPFRLARNDDVKLYLVNQSTHGWLVQSN